ncbi:MAG: hypothetical protein QGI11_03395, partial [Nitrospinota bacterium]|nr:hypothetical protein [Nitrospinota bacterium]
DQNDNRVEDKGAASEIESGQPPPEAANGTMRRSGPGHFWNRHRNQKSGEHKNSGPKRPPDTLSSHHEIL